MLQQTSINFATKLAFLMAIPSSVVFIYLLWKQNKNSDENEESLEVDNTVRTRQTVIEIKVPADCVGAIIGTEGANIKEIQKSTGARITFKRTDNEYERTNEDRLLLIRGCNVNAQKAELEIRRLIADKPILLNEEMMVPKECCGRLIGRNGSNIKNMCKMTGCKISISRDPIFNFDKTVIHKCALNGSMEQILHAKELISEKIKEEENFRKKKQQEENQKKKRLLPNSQSLQYLSTVSSSSLDSTPLKEAFSFSSKKPETMNMTENENEVYVSAVATPHAFWVHIINKEATKLDFLIDDMTEFYNDRKCDSEFYLNKCNIGDIICAPHNAKGWYRCEIKGIKKIDNNNNNNNNDDDDNMELDIYYIDFGDSAYIKKYEARKLLAQFNELPCYAIKATLNGVEPIDEKRWSNDSIDYFEDITYSCCWKVLNAKLIGFNEENEEKIPIIDLFDPQKSYDIATKLIENNMATESKIITQAF